jgi:hypothetical protein
MAPDFLYISYIRTDPETLFKALMDPTSTKQYFFGVKFDLTFNPMDQKGDYV